ncbi:hypothetical protein HXX76_001605 [Chlamydomonas incerta]|uniref:EF-hand domain-containing protein n=1 Tax=Chlamydomonas incerta TaxID=51695 RepID=A0A835WCI9_CHLIN|nr:hypothetical protein HXX76_001605 [Chlamydomonas incerta]|eukprot:KAG2444867.1 hypothetical protein HXX76_001605 [Chlamydomonas incerta]
MLEGKCRALSARLSPATYRGAAGNLGRQHAEFAPAAVGGSGAARAGGAPGAAPETPHVVGDILATSSMEEVLRSAHHILTAAEQRIGDYCSTFVASPGPSPSLGPSRIEGGGSSGGNSSGGEEPPSPGRRCWHVYRSFSQARRRLEAAAAAEAAAAGGAGVPGAACADLEVLEKLVRELGPRPSELVGVLAANERLLGSLTIGGAGAVASSGAGGAGGGQGAGAGATSKAKEKAAGTAAPPRGAGGPAEVVPGLSQSQAEAVYARLDRRGRGWLDQDDLMAGLELLGEHLDASDVEQICLEMGSTGRVDMQAFCDIVASQRLVVPGSDAVFLRHVCHARPEWWSDVPHFLDNSP